MVEVETKTKTGWIPSAKIRIYRISFVHFQVWILMICFHLLLPAVQSSIEILIFELKYENKTIIHKVTSIKVLKKNANENEKTLKYSAIIVFYRIVSVLSLFSISFFLFILKINSDWPFYTSWYWANLKRSNGSRLKQSNEQQRWCLFLSIPQKLLQPKIYLR